MDLYSEPPRCCQHLLAEILSYPAQIKVGLAWTWEDISIDLCLFINLLSDSYQQICPFWTRVLGCIRQADPYKPYPRVCQFFFIVLIVLISMNAWMKLNELTKYIKIYQTFTCVISWKCSNLKWSIFLGFIEWLGSEILSCVIYSSLVSSLVSTPPKASY